MEKGAKKNRGCRGMKVKGDGRRGAGVRVKGEGLYRRNEGQSVEIAGRMRVKGEGRRGAGVRVKNEGLYRRNEGQPVEIAGRMKVKGGVAGVQGEGQK